MSKFAQIHDATRDHCAAAIEYHAAAAALASARQSRWQDYDMAAARFGRAAAHHARTEQILLDCQSPARPSPRLARQMELAQ